MTGKISHFTERNFPLLGGSFDSADGCEGSSPETGETFFSIQPPPTSPPSNHRRFSALTPYTPLTSPPADYSRLLAILRSALLAIDNQDNRRIIQTNLERTSYNSSLKISVLESLNQFSYSSRTESIQKIQSLIRELETWTPPSSQRSRSRNETPF
ncbi:MAG: hypothetical protein A3F67_07765 [Verrucomicrobia bacterium RIFCSPHIGHO2_12_FULL_41_10]|nr:MAG: hypothetical protein A3F67_07765 [Verrucomicrobia bacterium RIFCSPHIGHO2_12_FULL_41_10]